MALWWRGDATPLAGYAAGDTRTSRSRAWYIAPSRDVISMEGACEGSAPWESS